CNAIEACTKPVVAAIHGPASGGGSEVAMSAHYRVATASAKSGSPEVQSGSSPGAGGTQRAPRSVGAQAASDMMLSGRHVGAQEASRMGSIDHVATSDDVQAEGSAYVRQVLSEGGAVRRTRDLTEASADQVKHQVAVDAARAEVVKKRG
ncbi:hypothetical protein OY671_012489, partial [Metschnikowia pulcherrima]